MKWKHPPVIKIYEALGSIADDRIEVDGNIAKVLASNGNKYYDVAYDPNKNQIMANDNGSFWVGYLGYPSIAFLMKEEVLPYSEKFGNLLKGIKWKKINQKHKNNFDKTLEEIKGNLDPDDFKEMEDFVKVVDKEIKVLNIGKLGKMVRPPTEG